MNKVIIVALSLVVFFYLLKFLSPIALPVIIACFIAYLLQPLTKFLQNRLGFSQNSSAFLVFILFVLSMILLVITIFPVVYDQIMRLVYKIPTYKEYVQNGSSIYIQKLLKHFNYTNEQIFHNLQESLDSFVTLLFVTVQNTVNNLWSYTLATINLITLFFIVPVILFYVLRDWSKIAAVSVSLIPVLYRHKVREVFMSIVEMLSVYIRGQFNICCILAAYYSISFAILGLDLWLLMGVLSGFFVIIPFIGTFISLTLCIVVSVITFGMSSKILWIIGIYVFGSIIEGYFLTPKIIGNKMGLHPLLIMLAIFIGASTFGIVGMFLAIPALGILKICVKHAMCAYTSSKYYQGF